MYVRVCVCVCLYSGQPVSTTGLCAEREREGETARERERDLGGWGGTREGRMDVFDG